MRNNTILMFMFCASVFVSIGYFIISGQSPKAVFMKAISALEPTRVRDEPGVVEAASVAPKTTHATTRRAPVSTPFRASVPVVAAEPELVVEVAPPPPPKPKPSASDRLVGMTKSDLLEKFSAPSLQLSSVKHGDVLESIYYNVKESSKAITLELRNGVVTSVQPGNFSSPSSQ